MRFRLSLKNPICRSDEERRLYRQLGFKIEKMELPSGFRWTIVENEVSIDIGTIEELYALVTIHHCISISRGKRIEISN